MIALPIVDMVRAQHSCMHYVTKAHKNKATPNKFALHQRIRYNEWSLRLL